MSITQNDIQAIKQAIQQLSRVDREALAEWILDASIFEPRVEETALAYGGARRVAVEKILWAGRKGGGRYEDLAGQRLPLSTPPIRHQGIWCKSLAPFAH